MIENTINNNSKEETNVIVGDTKMKRTKTITVEVQVHKELKKAEVEGIFTLPGVTFEVKRRTVYATKEVSSYSEEWNFQDLCKKWDFEEEAGSYIIETMEALYIEKCHVYAAEFERKAIVEEAARVAKLKEDGLIDEQGRDIEVEEETNENKEETGETEKMVNNDINDINDINEETNNNVVKETGETTMLENNAKNVSQEEENYFFSNNVFYYDWNNSQSVDIDNNNYAFNNGYHYEQVTEIYGDNFFNSVLKSVLEDHRLYYYKSDNALVFKNILEDEDQDFEETPGFMVLMETQKKIAKIIEGYPADEIFKIKEENESIFQGLIDHYYDC